jgi:hypothetical protein
MIKICCPLFKEHLAEWILFSVDDGIYDDKFYYRVYYGVDWDWNTVEIRYCPFCGAKIMLE